MPDEQGQPGEGRHLTTKIGIDTEELTGRTFPYQFDRSLVEDVDLVAATPGADINWLEDVHLMTEDDVPAVFDRYTNAFLKIYFEIPDGGRGHLRAQGAHHPPARGQLLRHLAQEQAREVPAARTRPLAGRLTHRRRALAAPGARGRGAARGPLARVLIGAALTAGEP